MDRKVSRRTGMVALLVTGALLALVPAAAMASCPLPTLQGLVYVNGTASGALLEVLESPPALAAPGGPTMPGAFSPGIGGQFGTFAARIAEATESGSLSGCGTLSGLSGNIEVHAQSRIPLTATGLGTGTISGAFQIRGAGNGATAGSLDGALSFVSNEACGGPCPLALASGTWNTLGRNRTAGGFAGVALVPVPLGCSLDSGGCFYVDLLGVLGQGEGAFIPLDPNTEYSKQFRTGVAKFVITLYQ